MISIIICSANEAALQEVLHSIEHTIGVPYEAIVVENHQGKFGLSEAYNKGAAKAHYDVFCFMHEDVCFETNDWGRKVLNYLSNKAIGLIGVAGGDTKGRIPSSWSSFVFASEVSLVQHFKHSKKPPERICRTGYPGDVSTIKPVVSMDGVWMCTRRDIYEHCRFDDRTFRQFHGYDIDFSLQVLMKYKVCVVFDILLHHYSEGSYTKNWLDNMILLSNKWKHQLPVSVRDLSEKEYMIQHWTAMVRFIDNLIYFQYKLPAVYYQICKYSFNRYFRVRRFLYSLKYAFQAYYNRNNKHSNSN